MNDSIISYLITYSPAPSAAPVDLTFLSATSSSITLQWKAVPCIHQNGNITGYMIEYEEVDDENEAPSMNKSIVGDQKEMTTGSITGLRPLTHYDIRVAAVNSAGIGPFTSSSNASTSGITKYTHTSIHDQWVRIIIVVVLIQLHSITSYSDCPGYRSSESGSDTYSKSTTVITVVVCSLAFLSVGVLLGAVGLHLVQRARGMLSKSPSPSLPRKSLMRWWMYQVIHKRLSLVPKMHML